MIDADDSRNLEIAKRWCASRGSSWELVEMAGRGGTAPVYEIKTPDGIRALKLLDEEYSTGSAREESLRRVEIQRVEIGVHDCPNLVKVYDGGEFENRIFLLMNKAPGAELAKKLQVVPRDKIRGILDQITRACIFLRQKGLCHRDIKSENIFVSDDFSQATLLDVSVARKIYDPIGIGTDEGNRLPVVATSRYTPPEYLFRLIPPGEQLWHAVDVYQLGCLIHDLVMREQMFEDEYQRSSDNRYRFAWIVATRTPNVAASDIDTAIILLGQRALDKNHERRSLLKLEDFLQEKESISKLGLGLIGLGQGQSDFRHTAEPVNVRQLLQQQARTLEESVRAYQAEKGVRAVHSARAVDDARWQVSFEWRTKEDQLNEVALAYMLTCESTSDTVAIQLNGSLTLCDANKKLSATIDLPPLAMTDGLESALFSSAIGLIAELATQIMNQNSGA
ncbi:protein kinase domain-containing protein [Agrobacterium salinitolerans]|uniref:protein kinase domain-containing protein n=1 Tax=Agrobacterium salinitolerans TaxID=1183413 RepID=UPI003FD43D52